eukprot:COSAG02_NODE_20989_length_807_cov_0.933616_1_plen_48_part_00
MTGMRWSVYVLVLALVCVAPPTVKPERTQQDVEPCVLSLLTWPSSPS